MTQNTEDIQDLQDRGAADRISIKSLYKKIVALEIKFDTMWVEQRAVRDYFKKYVSFLFYAVIIDIIFSVIFVGLHLR